MKLPVFFERLPHAGIDGAPHGLPVPKVEKGDAVGLDLRAALLMDGRPTEVRLFPGDQTLIPTGFNICLPEGTEGQVRPRSGLAAKHGITVLNTPGTIDPDYRGEVKVILINLGRRSFVVSHGDRIAQLVVVPRAYVFAVEASFDSMAGTARGADGFGSTGT